MFAYITADAVTFLSGMSFGVVLILTNHFYDLTPISEYTQQQ